MDVVYDMRMIIIVIQPIMRFYRIFIYKSNPSPLKLPPSKFLLDIYGGPLTREEYLNDQTKYTEELSNCIHLNRVFQKNDKRLVIRIHLQEI